MNKRSIPGLTAGVMAKLPALFGALCDPNRMAMLAWLARARRPCSVSEIAGSGVCPVDFSVVSRHLITLRDAGILGAERRGREVLYHVRIDSLVATLRGLADALEGCCAPAATKDDPA